MHVADVMNRVCGCVMVRCTSSLCGQLEAEASVSPKTKQELVDAMKAMQGELAEVRKGNAGGVD